MDTDEDFADNLIDL